MRNLFSIWETDRQFWPKASDDFVFLAAAFNEVGERLCGQDWTGREALTPPTPDFDAWRKWDNGRRLSRLPPPPVSLGSYRPGSGPIARHEPPKIDPVEDAKADARWAERVSREQETNAALIARRYKAAGWIAERARNGELQTFGITRFWEPRPLANSNWFGSDDWALFAKCETKLFVSPKAGAITLQIFVSRDGLDKCLARLAMPTVAGKVSAERQAEAWLREEFAKVETASKAKAAFKADAMDRFDGLSGEGFGRAWDRATLDHPERRNPGAKSKGHSAE